MRKLLLAAAVAATFLGAQQPVRADTPAPIPVTFDGATPCGPACAYWPATTEAGFKACENPFPPGSYVDILTDRAPAPPAGKKVILILETFPQIDWDTFICGVLSNGSHNGGELARGVNLIPGNCDNLLGPESPVPLGCEERAMTPATPGARYVLRAYNWSDVAPCPGRYSWVFV
ncbi:MAG: hypothetical protein WDA27_10090 [Actinomycetota bacterium]